MKEDKNIGVEYHQIDLDDKSAERLLTLFKLIIQRAEVPVEPRIGLDGTTYNFELKDNNQWIASHVWTPEYNTYADKCVSLADILRDTVIQKENISALNTGIDAVEQLLPEKSEAQSTTSLPRNK